VQFFFIGIDFQVKILLFSCNQTTFIPSNVQMMHDDDFYWIGKVLLGDLNAFGNLVEKYQDMVYTIVFKVLQHETNAEDTAQHVFMKAYEGLKGFKKDAGFSTWLYRIAFNTAISELRKQSRQKLEFADQSAIERIAANKADELADEKETQEYRLQKALNHLQPEENLMINLYYAQNLSTEEIGKVLGMGVSNVKVRLFRIRKKIEDIMLVLQPDQV